MKKTNMIVLLMMFVLSLSVVAVPIYTGIVTESSLTSVEVNILYNESVNATIYFSANSDLSSPLLTETQNNSDDLTFSRVLDLTDNTVYYYEINGTSGSNTNSTGILEVSTQEYLLSSTTRIILSLLSIILASILFVGYVTALDGAELKITTIISGLVLVVIVILILNSLLVTVLT